MCVCRKLCTEREKITAREGLKGGAREEEKVGKGCKISSFVNTVAVVVAAWASSSLRSGGRDIGGRDGEERREGGRRVKLTSLLDLVTLLLHPRTPSLSPLPLYVRTYLYILHTKHQKI